MRDVVDGRWAESAGDSDLVLGEGLWALPGLVDAHSHVSAAELDYRPGSLDGAMTRAAHALRAGVMLLLDKGWTDDVAVRLADAMPSEERPDIEAAAVLIAGVGGYYPDFAREVTPEQLEAAVAAEAKAGRGWVKLVGDWPRKGVGPVANFDEGQLRKAVGVASALEAKVAIHTMAREVPSMAVAAGVHSIEHGLFLTEEDIALLAARSGMWVPTLLRIEETIAQLGKESSGGSLLSEGLSNTRSLLAGAVEAGVHVLAGTDLVGAPSELASEALEMMQYGLSSAQIVDAVSRSGLRATGRPAGFEVGASADAVLFAADPLVEPGVLAHPHQVIRRGRVV